MLSCFVEVDGLRVHYLRAGAGPALIMVHGLVGSAGNWDANIPALAAVRTVYALDLVNMGASGRQAGLPAGMDATAQRLERFMDAVGVEEADLVGSSHGGAICMTLAARSSQRVRSLLLFAPANPFCERARGLLRFYNTVPGGLFARAIPLLPKFVLHMAHARVYGDRSKVRREQLESYTAGLNRESIEHTLRIVRVWWDDMAALRERLPDVARRPVLLLWGDRDGVVGMDSGLQLRDALGAAWVVIQGSGHLPFAEDPDGSNAAMVRFLSA